MCIQATTVSQAVFFFDKIEVSPTPLKFDSHVEEENPVIKNFIDECHEFEIVEE